MSPHALSYPAALGLLLREVAKMHEGGIERREQGRVEDMKD